MGCSVAIAGGPLVVVLVVEQPARPAVITAISAITRAPGWARAVERAWADKSNQIQVAVVRDGAQAVGPLRFKHTRCAQVG